MNFLLKFEKIFTLQYETVYWKFWGRDSSVSIATTVRAGRSGDRILVEARFSAPFQTVSGNHPGSYKMGTGSLTWGKAVGVWR